MGLLRSLLHTLRGTHGTVLAASIPPSAAAARRAWGMQGDGTLPVQRSDGCRPLVRCFRPDESLQVLTSPWTAVWVKICSSWAGLLLYLWTLVAPLVLPDRDFS